jgi:hypothetical protein
MVLTGTHLDVSCLTYLGSQIGQKKPGYLQMAKNLGTIDASAYFIVLGFTPSLRQVRK